MNSKSKSKSTTDTRTFRTTTSVALALVASTCACDARVETTRLALTSPVTVTFQRGTNGYAGAADTHLWEDGPLTTHGSDTSLTVDGDEPNGAANDSVPLFRWDVSSILAGSTVTAVSVTLQVTNPSPQTSPCYALRRTWVEASASWANASTGTAWQTAGAAGTNDRDPMVIGTLQGTATGARTFSLNAAGIAKVQGWVNDSSTNFGVICSSPNNNDSVKFQSSEYATAGQRPRLTVVYSPPAAPDAAVDATPDLPGTGGSATGGTGTGGAGTGGIGTGGSGSGGDGSGGNGGATVDAAGAADAGTGGAGTGGAGTGGAGTGGAATGGAGTGGIQGPPAFLYAAGDIGYSTTTTDTATGLLLDGSTDPVAVLGDIAYQNGSSRDFTRNFVPPWGRHKPRIKPTPGNHEYQTAGASGYFGYFGAAASPSTGYYSYNLGAWHIVVLNTGTCTASPATCISAAQVQWLRNDLTANPRACTLAYWHHPRFSAGEHGADAATNSVAVLWDVLLEFGADVILNGHDHNYERFAPQNTAGQAVANGIAQFVVGSGGAPMRELAFTPSANSVARNTTDHGMLKLTLRDSSYDWRFIPIAGKTYTDTGSANCH